MPPTYERADVECYAGHKGQEIPRAVVIEGKRLEVVQVLSRGRSLDASSGRVRESWHCRLDDGRIAAIELPESGAWRVSIPG